MRIPISHREQAIRRALRPGVDGSAMRRHPGRSFGPLLAVACGLLAGGGVAAAEPVELPVEAAVLVAPPAVPPPIMRRHAARVTVDLEVRERVGRLAEGVTYEFATFGGTVPGLFIRVREGDLVEFRLHNHPSSRGPHNIALQAVTGPGAGGAASFTAPGRTSQFTFAARRPGLYVYQSATAPVPEHVASGLYGLLLVEPAAGLPRVDREYYVMQGEFYTRAAAGEGGRQVFDPGRAADERPTYVAYNGAADALVGERALRAQVGEAVRVYFGAGGPNLGASLHVVGELFDRVYPQGRWGGPQENVSVVSVPSGGAAIVELHFDVPGSYVIADHALSRAYDKGAMGVIEVTGLAAPALYSGKQADRPYATEPAAPLAASIAAPPGGPLSPQMERGQKVYLSTCFACHLPNGLGVPPVFPPLAGSDYLKADRERAIRIVLHGLSGPITVNGQTFNSPMPPQELTDSQVADVLTFVMNNWGHALGTVTAEEVKRVRAALE